MPSTNSSKPCTNCLRDCSPSLTMSMPASSCSFSQRSVASRLARASSSPLWRQVGQSLFVSASQPGLGRLPAMVVLNIFQTPVVIFGQRRNRDGQLYFSATSNGQGRSHVVAGMLVGTFFSFLLGIFNPLVANKAGPDWLWMGGRDDVLRSLYFRPNGSFR